MSENKNYTIQFTYLFPVIDLIFSPDSITWLRYIPGSPLLGIFPAGGPSGETECQYLSGGQYSALNRHLICGFILNIYSSDSREENLYVFTNSVDSRHIDSRRSRRAKTSESATTQRLSSLLTIFLSQQGRPAAALPMPTTIPPYPSSLDIVDDSPDD